MDSQFFQLLKSLLSWLHCLGTFVENLLKFYIYNFTCQLYLSKAGKRKKKCINLVGFFGRIKNIITKINFCFSTLSQATFLTLIQPKYKAVSLPQGFLVLPFYNRYNCFLKFIFYF